MSEEVKEVIVITPNDLGSSLYIDENGKLQIKLQGKLKEVQGAQEPNESNKD